MIGYALSVLTRLRKTERMRNKVVIPPWLDTRIPGQESPYGLLKKTGKWLDGEIQKENRKVQYPRLVGGNDSE